MRGQDSFNITNVAAGAYPFRLEGGVYAMSVVSTFGGGNVKLQQLGADNVTFVDIKQSYDDGSGALVDLVTGSFIANGQKVYVLPPGQYQVLITTATASYVNVSRCPGD